VRSSDDGVHEHDASSLVVEAHATMTRGILAVALVTLFLPTLGCQPQKAGASEKDPKSTVEKGKTDTKPADAKPTDKPADAKPEGDAKPADAKPEESKK
jgi:hypothetical protein